MLQEALDTGVTIYGDYRFALVLLERAKSDPQWPRWVPASPTSQPGE
jgi:hypothetical protein